MDNHRTEKTCKEIQGENSLRSQRTVKRAIIMAAGKGERLRPLTLEKPKSLIAIGGKRMINSVIEALHANGIKEIYVVVGYLKDQFVELEHKYPGLKLIENPFYETCNNISSLYVARDYLSDVVILDADQIISNQEVLNPHFEKSSYCCFWQDKPTVEWLLSLHSNVVTSCSRNGGEKGWQLQSVSFWTDEDGKQLKDDVEEVFVQKEMRDLFWDDIALFVFPEHYQLGIRQIQPEDIVEIDSLDELVAQDSSYSSSDHKITEKR